MIQKIWQIKYEQVPVKQFSKVSQKVSSISGTQMTQLKLIMTPWKSFVSIIVTSNDGSNLYRFICIYFRLEYK